MFLAPSPQSDTKAIPQLLAESGCDLGSPEACRAALAEVGMRMPCYGGLSARIEAHNIRTLLSIHAANRARARLIAAGLYLIVIVSSCGFATMAFAQPSEATVTTHLTRAMGVIGVVCFAGVIAALLSDRR